MRYLSRWAAGRWGESPPAQRSQAQDVPRMCSTSSSSGSLSSCARRARRSSTGQRPIWMAVAIVGDSSEARLRTCRKSQRSPGFASGVDKLDELSEAFAFVSFASSRAKSAGTQRTKRAPLFVKCGALVSSNGTSTCRRFASRTTRALADIQGVGYFLHRNNLLIAPFFFYLLKSVPYHASYSFPSFIHPWSSTGLVAFAAATTSCQCEVVNADRSSPSAAFHASSRDTVASPPSFSSFRRSLT